MNRAPHPALAALFRQASTPSRLLTRLKANEELLARVEAEPVAGGEGGDELLVRLTRGLELGELLDPVLARLQTPAATANGEHPRTTRSAEVRPPRVIPPTTRGRAHEPAPEPRQAATSRTAALPDQPPIARTVSFRPPGNQATRQPSNPETPKPSNPATPSNPVTPKPRTPAPPLPFPTAATPPRRRAKPASTRTLPDAAAASEALVKRATRRGVIEALHQPVGSGVPPRVAVVLQQSVAEPAQAAAPNEPLQRLAATVDRIEHVGSRRAAPTVAHAPADDRVTVVPLAAPSPDRQLLAPPVGGFRGLVALAEAQQRPRSATPREERPAPPPAQPALDDATLTARISEILRRDAERHGIDMTGVEP